MAIREIVKIGTKSLREKSTPIFEINDDIHILIEDMFDTMYSNNGIGLAASQVGINMRLFIIDIDDVTKEGMVFINPNIIKKSTKTNFIEEGCL